jgi:hypothetical protein
MRQPQSRTASRVSDASTRKNTNAPSICPTPMVQAGKAQQRLRRLGRQRSPGNGIELANSPPTDRP